MTSLVFLLAIVGLAASILLMRRRRIAGLAPSWPLRGVLTLSLIMLATFVAIYLLFILSGDSL